MLSIDYEMELICYISLCCKGVSLSSQMMINLYRLTRGYYDFSDPYQVFNMAVFTSIPIIFFLCMDPILIALAIIP